MVRRTISGISRFPDVQCTSEVRVFDAPRNDDAEGSRIMAYYVYILASRKDGATYIGVTNDIVRRVYEHRIKAVPGFTSKYNITRLVWFEIYEDPISAISREKELKKWKRAWKMQLIEAKNPQWNDLYESICT
jgi:putative endonuclease